MGRERKRRARVTPLAKNIRVLREARGFTQAQLAERMVPRVKRSALAQWETAATAPKLLSLVALAAALRVSVDVIVNGEEPHNSGLKGDALLFAQDFDRLPKRLRGALGDLVRACSTM